jgi:hypothetical protein
VEEILEHLDICDEAFTTGQRALHRYLDALLGLVDETFPVELPDVQAAKEIALGVSMSCRFITVMCRASRADTR